MVAVAMVVGVADMGVDMEIVVAMIAIGHNDHAPALPSLDLLQLLLANPVVNELVAAALLQPPAVRTH